MAVRDQDIVSVWDGDSLIEKNIDFLRTPTSHVEFPLSAHVKNIIADLIDTFQAIPCAGIAANQLGYDKKIFIGMKYYIEDSDYNTIPGTDYSSPLAVKNSYNIKETSPVEIVNKIHCFWKKYECCRELKTVRPANPIIIILFKPGTISRKKKYKTRQAIQSKSNIKEPWAQIVSEKKACQKRNRLHV